MSAFTNRVTSHPFDSIFFLLVRTCISHSFLFLPYPLTHASTHARTYVSFLFLDTLYSIQFLFDHVFFFYRNPTKVRVDLDRLRNSPRKRRSKGFSFQRYKIYKRRSRAVVRELASPRPMAVTVIDATRSMLNEISSYRSRLTRQSQSLLLVVL